MVAIGSLVRLSRKHGVIVDCGVGGSGCGHSAIKSAVQMNKAVVLFLERVEEVNMLVETGILLNGLFVQVALLKQPAANITLP